MFGWIGMIVVASIPTSWILTGVARWLAPKMGLVDRPDTYRKRHARPVPRVGGVGFFATLVLCVGAIRVMLPEPLAGGLADGGLTEILLASAGCYCILGLCDDKWNLKATNKLLWQVAASLPFVLWGQSVDSVKIFGIGIHLGIFAPACTVLWLVACSNVINLVDGLDGLAGTIGLIASVSLALLSALSGQYWVAAVSLILAGSLVGFLIHNWPPAKIFMGDCGSLTLGFLLGGLSIQSSLKTSTGFTLVTPLVLISVPVFDTLVAILRRKLRGRSVGAGDRGHIHHCLEDRGLTRLQVLLTLAGLSLAMAVVAVSSAYFGRDLLAVIFCGTILSLLIAGRIFGHREVILLIDHLRAVGTLIADTSRILPSRILTARFPSLDVHERHEYWAKICERVAGMGGTYLRFRGLDPRQDRVLADIEWGDGGGQPPADTWRFELSVLRGDDVQATMAASGTASPAAGARRLDDLFRLFEAFCRHWPLPVSQAVDADLAAAPTILYPIPQRTNADATGDAKREPSRRAA